MLLIYHYFIMLKNWITALVFGSAIAHIFSVTFMLWLRKQLDYKTEQLIEEDRLVRGDLRKIMQTIAATNVRVEALEDSYSEINNNQKNKHELRNLSLSSYSHAAKMAEKGFSEDELMVSLGLTKAEAQLVKMINKRQIAGETR
jgi:hypothetical protein